MNCVIVSYGSAANDGRLRELAALVQPRGTVTVIACGPMPTSSNGVNWKLLESSRNRFSFAHYVSFLFHVLRQFKELRDAEWIISDDMYAAPVGWLIRFLFRSAVLIQDVRELYVYEDMPNLAWKAINRIESGLMRRADAVLCASIFRGSVMRVRYGLAQPPIEFMNIRSLDDASQRPGDHAALRQFMSARFKLVTTGGWATSRRTDDLVRAVGSLGDDYALAICGGGSSQDRELLESLICESGAKVVFLGSLSAGEMRYVIEAADAGVVSYHREDLNNEFCAPGKIYEYVALGKPVVCTANAPLAEFCSARGVGVANEIFEVGIKSLFEQYDAYAEAVSLVDVAEERHEQQERVLSSLIEVAAARASRCLRADE